MKVLIDNGHGINTNGKCSPDHTLFEYKWTREIAQGLEDALKALGIDAERIVKEETDISISTRVNRVNQWCHKLGAKNVILISIHNNALGNNGQWCTASGFSVFVSKNASANSKRLAQIFTNEAIKMGLMGNRAIPDCQYWTWSWTPNDIGILKNTNCPAVLTENLFQDNKADVKYLLSDAGKRGLVNLHVAAILKYMNLN